MKKSPTVSAAAENSHLPTLKEQGFIGPQDVMLYLGIKKTTFNQMRKSGKLPSPIGYIGRKPIWSIKQINTSIFLAKEVGGVK